MRPLSSAAAKRAAWLEHFRALVERELPGHVVLGRDAVHLHDSGYTPGHAAERYLAARRVERNSNI